MTLNELIQTIEIRSAVALGMSKKYGDPKHHQEFMDKSREDIKALFLKLVGEDDSMIFHKPVEDYVKHRVQGANNLKATLRARIEAL